MNPLIWTVLITGLSTGSIITMMSHHWLLAWLGLELNTLSILPIIIKPHHPRATEATTEYFLVHATVRAVILFASSLNAWQSGQWSIMATTNPAITTTLALALLLNLGVAPAHFWYPDVLHGSAMRTALLMSTWQKLAPLSLLYMIISNAPTQVMLFVGLLSTLIGGWAGLNQTQLRKIMAFSSIAHMGWLITATTINPSLASITLSMYIIMTSSVFHYMDNTTAKTISDLSTAQVYYPAITTTMMVTLMSLGGLPPMTGFMPKWLILKELTLMNMPFLCTMLALSSLPSLFFYIRMTYLISLTTAPSTNTMKHKWRFKNNPHTYMTLTTVLSLLLLPITPLMYNSL
uniref:NADH-ubiquinone oxidoreductase chain 2 n=1 Tax=Rhoptropella ocellata TaxID=232317 RepID=B1PHR6_9SAUR|nr:NADH dehydrogenase subunit 2 [Rhoptropella ocellata]